MLDDPLPIRLSNIILNDKAPRLGFKSWMQGKYEYL